MIELTGTDFLTVINAHVTVIYSNEIEIFYSYLLTQPGSEYLTEHLMLYCAIQCLGHLWPTHEVKPVLLFLETILIGLELSVVAQTWSYDFTVEY